jgi:hypothetical protein
MFKTQAISLHDIKFGTLLSSAKWGSTCHPLHAGFLLVSFFDPEDGYNMFLRNIG